MPFARVHLDVCKAPSAKGKSSLVCARCDLTGWPEGRLLAKADSQSIAKFIYEDIIYRHRCVLIIIINGGPKNKALVRELLCWYKIKNIVITPYNP